MQKKAGLLILLAYVILYLAPLGVRPIAIIDEARYGAIPREMIYTGDWVVPHLNGLRYFEKPVLGYWLTSLSIMAWGPNGFGCRFPSAVAAGLSVLAVFLLLRRHAPGPQAGYLGAAVQLTCVLPMMIGVANVLDTMFTFFVTATVALFYEAWAAPRQRVRLGWLALCGVACGAAFLVKGFIALAVPLVTIVPFLLWERRWKDLFTMPWIPLLVAVLVVLPWALAIDRRESDYWHYFVWIEHFNRFVPESLKAAMHASPFWRDLLGSEALGRTMQTGTQHPESFFYFIPVLLAGALPWTVLSGAAVLGLRRGGRDSFLRFAGCWFVFPLLFYSASSGKLATYILPCFPPLALLMDAGIRRYVAAGRAKALAVGCWILAVLVAGAILFFAAEWIVRFTGRMILREYAADEQWKVGVVVLACAWWLAGIVQAIRTQAWARRLVWFFVAAFPFCVLAHVAMPAHMEIMATAEHIYARNADRIPADAILVSDRNLAHSFSFFAATNNIYLFESRGEMEYGLDYPDARHRLLTVAALNAMVRAAQGRTNITLMITAERFDEFKAQLPPPAYLDREENVAVVQFF